MTSISDFSNKVSQDKLNKLAEMDHHNVVNQVQEVYFDFQAINPNLFSLDIPSTVNLTAKKH
jgi:hypothetical protein